METIGLRELNQNPSKVVARVRAGASIVVTDRGKPVLRMVPEVEHSSTLQRMLDGGEVTPPAKLGMPDLMPDLLADVPSLAEIMIADREKERRR